MQIFPDLWCHRRHWLTGKWVDRMLYNLAGWCNSAERSESDAPEQNRSALRGRIENECGKSGTDIRKRFRWFGVFVKRLRRTVTH